ncbi:hypothetical protein [Microvirga zambiensis]|uniref:hypothetical protein n=1 Tax=Microvirga zambiensis TaxID=1402137 RepID=UPI001920395A|nr:hypothetical protein [Microvirga zambiensis]
MGCLIEVPYRTKAFVADDGERITLPPFLPEDVEARFRAAVSELPHRFLGITRPGRHPEHLIEIRHHTLGSVRFHFRRSKVLRKGGLDTYFRECRTEPSSQDIPAAIIRERVVTRTCARPGKDNRTIPEFFRDRDGILVDVAWGEDTRGMPILGMGKLRYPIAYPDGATGSTSGVGAHYSAPFVSDTERHGLAPQEAWNDSLIEACDALFVDAFARLLVPRYGSKAFSILLGPDEVRPTRFEMMLGKISKASALPVVRPGTKGKSAGKARTGKRCLVPILTMRPERYAPELAALAPTDEWLLAPGAPEAVVQCLASRCLPGWNDSHITFDETDILDRLKPFKPDEETVFPWPSEASWRRVLRDPKQVVLYLDVLARAKNLSNGKLSFDKAGVHLPDMDGRPCPIERLHSGVNVPGNLPGLQLPPRVHPAIAEHPVLKAWRIPVFSFDDFLDSFNAVEASDRRCADLFKWVCENPTKVPKVSWPKLRGLPIWPDSKGAPGSLERLCNPKAPSRAGDILAGVLHRPHPKALKLAGHMGKRGLCLKFRLHPTEDEIDAWLGDKVAFFPTDRPLTAMEQESFRQFENELRQLAKDRRVAAMLPDLAADVPALSQAGILCLADGLVRRSPMVDRLSLLPEHLLDRPARELDTLVPPARKPSASIVLAALRSDPENEPALIPRLQALDEATPADQPLGIAEIRCIRVGDTFRAPAELAFKGNSGDYWGQWRLPISGAKLARIDQNLYKRAGVLPAEPFPDKSKAFFEWLDLNPDLVDGHLPQVLRHIGHERGTQCWWTVNDTLPCIPVERGGERRLVSRREAISASGRCYVDDFPELGMTIREDDASISLAIDKHAQVTAPITTILLLAGLRSLRRVAKDPVSVTGKEGSPAPTWVTGILEKLRSDRMARELKKRLDRMGVDLDLLEPRWHRRLALIQAIIVADEVSAVFKVERRKIAARVARGFDEVSGTLWLAKAGADLDVKDALFDALCERIFVFGAPLFLGAALERALRVEIHEAQRDAALDDDADGDDEGQSDDDGDNLGEAPNGHHDWQPDPAKNRPAPRPLSSNSGNVKASSGPRRPSADRPAAPDEEVQRHELKAEHYAWHCQIGLARMQPGELAPPGSYVEHQENRQRLIEAHHPDAVKSGGARHAGNLLILSHLEHHRYGQRISRGQITAALKSGGTRRVLEFRCGTSVTTLEGLVIEVEIPATGEKVPIFFTDDHRDYWLSQAN